MTAGTTSGDRFRSWSEILANAARAAGGLRALGVAEDDSVALMLRNDFATFEVNVAAAQRGILATTLLLTPPHPEIRSFGTLTNCCMEHGPSPSKLKLWKCG